MSKRLIVIGAGAAGFFCAVNAARMHPTLKVVLIEKTSKLLSKVKVSGGGRCNVTHACFDIVEMIKKYPRGGNFLKKTFHNFFTTDTIQWFEERGVNLKTEADGRMFPITDSSETIIKCLLNEADKFSVEVIMNCEVTSLLKDENAFKVLTLQPGNKEMQRELHADFVCIATGGYPKSIMFNWLRNLGHTIEEPVPSLFTFNMPNHAITTLMGVVVENAKVKITGTSLEQTGPLLITHWGLSGPAILRLSAWAARNLAACNWHFSIIVNWVSDYPEQRLIEKFQELRYEIASQKLSNKNPFLLPQRLWHFLLEQCKIDKEKRWADLLAKEQNILVKELCAHNFDIKGKTTFKEEFVTAGGVQLAEVNAATMMSKKITNLFFAGEVLDVDGITGGFNFQHAWTSAFIAAANCK